MPIKPGSIRDFANSMANEMATTFLSEWKAVMNNEPPASVDKQMQLMFVAIAKGMMKHLQANAGSFKVTVQNNLGTFSGTVTSIETIPQTL